MSHYDSRSHRSSRYESSSRSRYGGGSSSRMSGRRMPAPKNEFGISMGQPGASLRAPNWAQLDLPQFQKEFYREHPSVAALTDEEVQQWRDKHQMNVSGGNVPRPIKTFEEAGFPEYILTELQRAGFEKPTAIQSQGWPMAMCGRDVIGIAKTGSGKTLAFLLPSIVHINAQPLLRKGDGPIVLVVAPTRELAVQIQAEASKFGYSSRIKMTCVYGGVSKRDQAHALREGVEIIICTPGRLLDFLESGTTNLRRVTYLVIDEADRLLDMGFEPQLKSMLSQVRPDRQILLWSATWPKDVQTLANELIREDTIQVSVGSLEVHANHDVTQVIDIVEGYEKSSRLYRIMKEHVGSSNSKVLVFLATKRSCDSLCRQLRQDGWPALAIHGDKAQHERDWVLSQFKSGASSIMLATDVASRGIHVDDINLVVNYDFPGNIEDYVHRIGRTGRCGKKGLAISFFTRSDGKRAAALLKILEEAHQQIPAKLQSLSREFANERSHTRYRRRDRDSRNSSSASLPVAASSAAQAVLNSYSQAGYSQQAYSMGSGGNYYGGQGGQGGYGSTSRGPPAGASGNSGRYAPY